MTHAQEPLRILAFSASLRRESLNTRLMQIAVAIMEKQGCVVDHASMAEFDCPSYNQDLDASMPAPATLFRDRLEQCDAFIISSPEYNGSMPGLLKNAVDWVSRFRPQPFNEKHGLLMSASPSMRGGNMGLWSLRIPFEHLGARIYPDMFSLATAHKGITPEGKIADEKLGERFENTILAFLSLVEAAKHEIGSTA
jgi:NAD(P)H-dependent FMN reductase